MSELRVLIDGYWWTGGPPSGRNVLISLVHAWAAAFPEDRIVLARPDPGEASADRLAPPAAVTEVRLRTPQHAAAVMLELDARGRGADLVLSQNFTPLLSRALRAVYVHDVMFQEHPEWFSARERAYLSLIPRGAARADVIATSSQTERRRIEARNPRLAGRTIATGLAVSEGFRSARSSPPALPGLSGGFLLAVGRINVRKNLERLVRALGDAGVITARFPLVVVGVPDGLAGASAVFDDAVAAGSVIRAGFLPDSELKWLYENCAAFVFPSLDEGFGLPVLEAASSGARIALSAIPAFEEFGPVGDFFDPQDDASMVRAVRAAMARATPVDGRWAAAYRWDRAVAAIRGAAVEAGRMRRGGDRRAATAGR
ncbi:glycosyltransferase family 1 protein [Leifsonia sp. NPDC080035]|uniref:Glycosyltransferase family 1 protein n=1 Tax=Leifsonia sp. NPDC080035 TaxID=3143936 RepID=A0AAU7GDT5_9MICO